jgi:hypothetical protein
MCFLFELPGFPAVQHYFNHASAGSGTSHPAINICVTHITIMAGRPSIYFCLKSIIFFKGNVLLLS